jgi:hypothetical protein
MIQCVLERKDLISAWFKFQYKNVQKTSHKKDTDWRGDTVHFVLSLRLFPYSHSTSSYREQIIINSSNL